VIQDGQRRPAGGPLPRLDIDSLNEHIVAKVKGTGVEVSARLRCIGKARKTLLMYRTTSRSRDAGSRSNEKRDAPDRDARRRAAVPHPRHPATTLRPLRLAA